MTSRHLAVAIALGAIFIAMGAVCGQPDFEGSRDHPLITRMPGFFISNYQFEEFGAYEPTYGNGARWEGRKYAIAYTMNEGATPVSMLQITRNHEAAIRKAGGTILGGDERRVAAEIKKGAATTGVYVESFNAGRYYELVVVEWGDMRQDVTLDAAAMGRDLESSGRTILSGIRFDTGSAVIKPESQAELGEMVKLLKGNPSMKAAIVGHTDTVGSIEMNLKLSAARADALVKALVAHGIAPSRLTAFGAGPYSPVASNRTEGGRSQNRRVELVEQ